jgi:hypothetical protein
MAFSFNPDDGPARIIRYVARGTLPEVGLRALLDKKANLLIIDRDWFEALSSTDQQLVLKTQRPYLDTESRLAA